jgi:serine/threonine protein phosphatase 1
MLKRILNTFLGGVSGGQQCQVHLQDASLPETECVYVIGDIHGRQDLLIQILDVITRDSLNTISMNKSLIYLGDYIDRGPDSKGVIDTVLEARIPNIKTIALMGNHEEAMVGFLSDPIVNSDWLKFGGAETILSYGVSIPPGILTPRILKETSEALNIALPESHKQFLNNLKDCYFSGDYMFVHAGIDPDRKIAKQQTNDLFWIRNGFIEHTELYEKIIVHGHTIVDEPEFHDNRIAIDTGAYYSGKLTCLSLKGKERCIVQTVS